MKLKAGLIAAAALLALTGCSSSAEAALSDSCKAEATNGVHRPGEPVSDKVEAEVTDSDQRGDGDLYDFTGTTTVTTNETDATYTWTCFAQRVDGKNYAAVQSFVEG
jgi:hypothetical protein